MPNDNLLKYGILKCRDLVELYYGARMVTSVTETKFSASATPYLILNQDPRRIRYEVWYDTTNLAAPTSIRIGTPAAIGSGEAISFDPFISVYTLPLVRDFLTDLDSVCLALMVSDSSGQLIVSTRETFLTPAPVDEVPLG